MKRVPAALVDIVILVVIVAGGYWTYQNRNQLLDWYYLRNYQPPAQISALADQAGMTDAARRMFYRAHPQVDTSRQQLVSDCRIASDKTIELGCYLSSDQIYLLNISDQPLQSEMTVTAAHETLHAVYDRLSSSQKSQINSQLQSAYDNISDPKLHQRIAEYQRLEPGATDDELHSILGTEYDNLPPALEAYYAQYFKNRSQLVAQAQQFNQAFDGLHDQILQLDASITQLKATMNGYLRRGNVAAYNADVPVVNSEISDYNAKVQLYNRYAEDLLGVQSTANQQ